MVSGCLDDRRPFGVVLIKSGREVGETAIPHPVGTSAIITKATERADGQLDIIVIGYQRFRVLSLLHDRPYLRGVVETILPVDEDTEDAHAQAALLRSRLQQYVKLLGELTDTQIELDHVPEKPILLAFLTAILLQVPQADKQSLLAIDAIPEMLARENLLLLREQRFLQANIGVEFALDEGQLSFSSS
jgi:Lon protease-like protein